MYMQQRVIVNAVALALLTLNGSIALADEISDPVELPAVNVEVAKDGQDEVTSEKTKSYRNKKSSMSTRLNLSVKETPQSTSVVTRQLMNDFNVVNVNEALSLVPGINVESVETDRTFITSRGFDVTNFQLDGLNTPIGATFGNLQGDLDAFLYDRIEVLKGVNGLLTGVGNPSATVNFVRKRPTTDFQASVGALVGSWDRKRMTADVSGSLNEAGTVRARLLAAVEDKDSYIDRYGKNRKVLSGIIDFAVTDYTTVTLGHTYHQDEADSPLWGALQLNYSDGTKTDFKRSASNSAKWANWDNDTNNTFAELKTEFENGWEVLANISHNTIKSDSYLFYTYGDLDRATGNGMVAYPSNYEADIEQTIGDVYASGPFNLAGREHELVVGAQVAKSKLDHRSIHGNTAFVPIDYATYLGGTYAKPGFNLADGAYDGGSGVLKDKMKSVYGSMKINLTDDMKVIAGARYTGYEKKGLSYGVDNNINQQEWIPYIGAVYDINKQLTVYASATEIFLPQEEVDVTGKTLDPAEGRTYEAGAKYSFNQDKALLTASIFKTEQNRFAVATGELVAGSVALAAYDAQDGITSKGLELDVMGEVLPGLSLLGGYAYVDIRDADDKRTNTVAPKQTFKLATTYQLKSVPGLKVGAKVSWRDRTYGVLAKQESYAIWDASASYEVTPNLTANLNIYNLFDKEYTASLHWAGLFGQGFAGAPRSAVASMVYNF